MPELGRKMETMITFICDSSAGRGSPVIEKTDECTHFVTWKTNLTCEAEVSVHDPMEAAVLTVLCLNNDLLSQEREEVLFFYEIALDETENCDIYKLKFQLKIIVMKALGYREYRA